MFQTVVDASAVSTNLENELKTAIQRMSIAFWIDPNDDQIWPKEAQIMAKEADATSLCINMNNKLLVMSNQNVGAERSN
jgi:hypothetical protein